MIKFEVGKFYKVQTSAFSRKKIPALCTRVTKCTVVFQYIYSNYGELFKCTIRRRKRAEQGKEIAYVSEIWSTIANTTADELCYKPQIWEDVQ